MVHRHLLQTPKHLAANPIRLASALHEHGPYCVSDRMYRQRKGDMTMKPLQDGGVDQKDDFASEGFTGGCVLTASWCESDEGMPPRPENRSGRSPGKPAAGKTTASSQNRRYTLSVCLSLSKPLLVDCSGGGLQRCAILWLMNASFLVDSVGRPTSLPPHFSSIPLPFPLFLPILSLPLVLVLPSLPHPSFSRMALAGSHGQAQMPPEGRGGGHQARDHPGSQRLRLPPRGRPGLPRAPARTPQSPKSH